MKRILDINRLFKGAWMLAAPPTWTASLVPMAVGYVCALGQPGAEPSAAGIFWIVASVAAMLLIETGKHAVNDLVDFRSGNDPAVDAEHQTPFSGGKKVLTTGILTERETAAIAVLCLGAAAAIGLSIVWFWTAQIFWIGVAGVILSVIYTLPPVKLCYRGFGEVAVGLTYGPLIVLGAYFMFAENGWEIPLLLSLHIGLLITNVLVINEYPDYEADVAAGKQNLIARVGKQKGLRWYGALFFFLLCAACGSGCLGQRSVMAASAAAGTFYGICAEELPQTLSGYRPSGAFQCDDGSDSSV